MTDKTPTAADFANAEFARHPSGAVAARTDPRDADPWAFAGVGGAIRWRSDAFMAGDGWSPVRECPDKDVHWRYDEAQDTIQRLTKERNEARARLAEAAKEIREQGAAIAELAAVSRPLSPDAISDEFVERFRSAWTDRICTGVAPGAAFVRSVLTAALTEPPARPEGAEEIDEHLRQANAAALGGALTPEQRRALADHLAGFGYRTPIGLAEDGAA